MARPSSEDLRRRVVDAYLAGEGTYNEVAERFAVGRASVSRWLSSFRRFGHVAPKPHAGGTRSKIDAEGFVLLAQLVSKKPDITLAELATVYAERRGIHIALSIMCRAMKKLSLVRKKR